MWHNVSTRMSFRNKEIEIEKLLTISYISKGLLSNPGEDVASIVAESQQKNESLGISGILLHDGENFMQTIEGPPANTMDLYASIVEDGRHENVTPFGKQKIEERDFPDWKMELITPDETVRVVPDMRRCIFSYRRLREVHALSIEAVRRRGNHSKAKPLH